jgi:D-amino-acid dehydrogenase
MRIAVIGAGMAGVAAAQALAGSGHEVSVYERRAGAAEETSFAPAGIAAAGLAAPWLPPPGRLQAIKSGADDAALLHASGSAFARPALFGRGDAAAAARRAERALALHRLIAAGVERIVDQTDALRLDFECSEGLLLTLPDAAAQEQAELAVAWLQEAGCGVEWADVARQRAIEPGRVVADDAPRAAWLPGALVGNVREWTQLLRLHAQHLGARFHFQHEVAAIVAGPRPALHVAAAGQPAQELRFDAVVVCAAADSARLLAPLGLKLPWRAVRGCSVTVAQQVREAAPGSGPRAGLLDLRSGTSISRLGSRVRVAGCHVLAPGAATVAEPPSGRTLQPLYDAVDQAFPGAVVWQQAQVWQTARALLPDGLPAVGPSGATGVWLNAGHGHHGWALSQAAAALSCTLIAGEPAPAEAALLAPNRLY